ncbi:MAG: heparinase II/III-family protein, partial [Chloroflexota bacterium]
RCYTRPDGLAPNWGDNDSARVLGFDPRSIRDHRSLLALAAAYFGDGTFKAAARQSSAAIPWLLGMTGIQRWQELPVANGDSSCLKLFKTGGMAVSRADSHYLLADFGEVGLKGRGGHGHNDTFSFELALNGRPVIVDAGSPVYTGDLTMYDRYRSTSYHNVAQLDGQEMARLLGAWQISNEAAPTWVQFDSNPGRDIFQGEHQGYTRLPDPVVHRRTLTFFRDDRRLICQDSFGCAGLHRVERFLHFAPDLPVVLNENTLYAPLTPEMAVVVRWMPGTQARVERIQISENYSHLVDSWKLILEQEFEGNTELSFEIGLEQRVDR